MLSMAFVLSLGCTGAGYLLGVGPLRLVGVLGTLFLGVGTAPTQLTPRAKLATRLGVAGIIGFATMTVGGSIMVLISGWHPARAAIVIVLFAVIAHVRGCARALHNLSRCAVTRSDLEFLLISPNASVACTAVGTALWFFGVLDTGRVIPGVAGFLPKISPLWYLGLLLLVLAIALARGMKEAYSAVALLSLVAALTLTPALAYGMPRSQSAAKHIDLVQQVLSVNYFDRAAGIYQAYSGLFSGVGWICNLAHISNSTGLATYWPFLIELVVLVELRFMFGRVYRGGYRIWAGMTIVMLVNATGADYFSPQSVGFVLALGVYALVLGTDWIGFSERLRMPLLFAAGLALSVTHELSPFVVGGVLVVLVAFRVVRGWYIPALVIVPAVAWELLNWNVVKGFINFTNLFHLSNFAPPKLAVTPGLSRLPIVSASSYALLAGLLVLIGLAAVGFIQNLHDKTVRAFMVSAGVGLAVLVANPYGNEGIFRAALFGIPWLGLVATGVLWDRPPQWMTARFSVCCTALLGTFLIAMFGLDNEQVIRPADMQAMARYERVAAPNSDFLNLSYGNLPTNALFPPRGYEFDLGRIIPAADLRLDGPPASAADQLARNYVRAAAKISSVPPGELYAVWSPASVAFAIDYGLETQAQADRWLRLLLASPDWRVVFHRDGTYLFQVNVLGL